MYKIKRALQHAVEVNPSAANGDHGLALWRPWIIAPASMIAHPLTLLWSSTPAWLCIRDGRELVRSCLHPNHWKITSEIIWRLTEHNMSYKALYDIKYFLTLSALVMLFKAYPSCICFLSVILCFLKKIFFKRHIFLSVILCFLKNIFFKRHIFLSDILCFLKNIFVFPKNIYMFLKKHNDVIKFNRTCIWLVPLNNIYVILM